MATGAGGRLRIAGSAALLLLLTTVGVRTYLQSAPADRGSSALRTVVYIPPGKGVQSIARQLRESGVIHSAWAFLALAYLEGSLKRLQSGEYELSPEMSLREILQKLEAGRVVTHQVTIPEGFTADDVAALLASEQLVERPHFMALVNDAGFAKKLGVSAPALEGYLFPDTYRLTRGMGEEEILRVMVTRFRQALPPDFQTRADRLGLGLHGMVTLASLIEKEAVLDEERPLISAVFHNRLRRNMPLQSDPTAIYGAPGGKRRIRAVDLQRKSPYNTYLNLGLPPGPIANPGLASLLAAIQPSRVNFLYFVAKNDSSHAFSRTLEQHARAVRLYQGAGAKSRQDSSS